MLYIPKIDDYLFKDLDRWWIERFCSHRFSEYFKSTIEKLNSKLSEEQNLRKVDEPLYIFEVEKYIEIMQSNSFYKYVHCYNVEILYLFDPEFQLRLN